MKQWALSTLPLGQDSNIVTRGLARIPVFILALAASVSEAVLGFRSLAIRAFHLHPSEYSQETTKTESTAISLFKLLWNKANSTEIECAKIGRVCSHIPFSNMVSKIDIRDFVGFEKGFDPSQIIKENKQTAEALKLLAKLSIPLSQSLPMIKDLDNAIQKLTNKIIDLTNQKKDGTDVDEKLLAARTDIKTLMKLKADKSFEPLKNKFDDFTVNLDKLEKHTSLSQASLSEIRSYLMDRIHAHSFSFKVIGEIKSPLIKQHLETLLYEQFGSTDDMLEELKLENEAFNAYNSYKNEGIIKDGVTSITWGELDDFSGYPSSSSSPISRNSPRSSLDSPRSEDTLASESAFARENHPYLKPLRKYIEKKILEQVIADFHRLDISFNLNGEKTLPYRKDKFFIGDNFRKHNFVVNSIVPSQFSDLLTAINKSSKDSSYQNLKLALAAFFSSTQAFDADLIKTFNGKIEETLKDFKEKYGLSQDVVFGSFNSTNKRKSDKNNVSLVDDKLILQKDVVRELLFFTPDGPVKVPLEASLESIISGDEITTKFLSYHIDYDRIYSPK
jgi:superoxide dismutase